MQHCEGDIFFWECMKEDISVFVKTCLQCLVSRTGEVIPRPFFSALHATTINEVVHMDYLYIGDSISNLRYVILIRDDLSSYIWLWPTEAPTSEAAIDAIATWVGTFGKYRMDSNGPRNAFQKHLNETCGFRPEIESVTLWTRMINLSPNLRS